MVPDPSTGPGIPVEFLFPLSCVTLYKWKLMQENGPND